MMKLTRDYFADKLLELSGFFVVFAVGVLGIMIFFSDGYEYRWVALGLVATLLLLDFITHFRTAWHNSIPKQRLLMAMMTLNTIALLSPPTPIFLSSFSSCSASLPPCYSSPGSGRPGLPVLS